MVTGKMKNLKRRIPKCFGNKNMGILFSDKKYIYCFDIDNTLCTQNGANYIEAQPIFSRIKKVNRLYAEGHKIILYTARGATTGIDWKDLTERQLRQWKVKYHELCMGKPGADIYIDDKGEKADVFFKR